MDTLAFIFAIQLIVAVLFMLAPVVLVPVWGVLILVGKIDRRSVFSQRAAVVFMAAMTAGLLFFVMGLVGMWLTEPMF